METISIQSFGPVRQADIALTDINIFTGPASTGKSTLAKLLCVLNDQRFRTGGVTHMKFHHLLTDYNIEFGLGPDTLIRYESEDLYIEITDKAIFSKMKGTEIQNCGNPIFIPAERMFFASISESIFSLISSGIPLPKRFLDFGAQFERARNAIKKWRIDFLDTDYEYAGNTDSIKFGSERRIRLSEASSGLQSMIPMILVIQFNTERNEALKRLFVIEEPELNAHPVVQERLLEFIITKIKQSGSKIILTTHSRCIKDALKNHLDIRNKGVSCYDFNLDKSSLPQQN